ncbi:hypothetical protein IVB46_12405 [Bradyrhizobium sp. 61]|uniref:hypothetical protein n=1 Tax=unclassified Bradyrhizobium TaxID=2631580 RepID=UPI001FFB6843|nr:MULTISPECIES: hypothetical protein [unclassified Bradyrhizobium]MCK1276019.1 hypothetical protein [Bradyrhizobium sp. 61]MCK1448830.1 hypothetical protein [Bradyrhizobium sp. 48]MCK1465516.1 hypothetical protein [Bradyrhizobium sp. 2]
MTDGKRFQRPSRGQPSDAARLPLVLPRDETFKIDLDTGTPVDDQDHQVPFRSTGKIGKLTVKPGREEL